MQRLRQICVSAKGSLAAIPARSVGKEPREAKGSSDGERRNNHRFNRCWPRDQSASDLQADQYRHLKQIR
jgi:hypothetical protein